MAAESFNMSGSPLGGELDPNLVNHIYHGLLARGLSEDEAMEVLEGMVGDSGLDPYAQEGLLSGIGHEYNPFLDTGFYDEVDMQLDDIAQHVITGSWNPPQRTADQFTSDNTKQRIQQAMRNFSESSPDSRRTVLSEQQEGLFRNWYDMFSRRQGISENPDDPEHHYDYRGWWQDATDYDRAQVRNTPNSHLSDRFKLPGHETFSDESIYYDPSRPETTGGHWNSDGSFTPGPANPQPWQFDQDDFDNRQFYMESAFGKYKDSPVGARGPWQIMPATEADYVKATGKKGDVYDYNYAKGARDWYMNWLYNRPTVQNAGSELNKRARQVAAYNMGIGNLGKHLEKMKAQGMDVYNTTDWVDTLPTQETRDYVNFIVFRKDTTNRTNENYRKALSEYQSRNNSKARGGHLFRNGGDGDGFTAQRDNTATRFTPAIYSGPERHFSANGDVDITDSPLGYAPILGDALQAGQVAMDLGDRNFKRAALNAGLLIVPNFIEKGIKAGAKVLKSPAKYVSGAASRNSDGQVMRYYRDIVDEIVKREGNGDGFSFESDYLDTRRFVPKKDLGWYSGVTYGDTGVAEYPVDASGATRVHEHRHQLDPQVFDSDAHNRRIAVKARNGETVDIYSPEYSTQFINQITLNDSQKGLLREAYPSIKDIDELPPVNREMMYHFYDKYYREFGKYPTLDELSDYIATQNRYQLSVPMVIGDVGYMSPLDAAKTLLSKTRAEKLKKAMLHVPSVAAPLAVGTAVLKGNTDE